MVYTISSIPVVSVLLVTPLGRKSSYRLHFKTNEGGMALIEGRVSRRGGTEIVKIDDIVRDDLQDLI